MTFRILLCSFEPKLMPSIYNANQSFVQKACRSHRWMECLKCQKQLGHSVVLWPHSDTDQTHILVNMSCLNAWKKKKQQQKTQTKQTLSLSCNINRNAWTNALQPNQELEILEKLQAATTSQNCFNIFSIIIKTVWHFWLLNRKLINKFSCVVCAIIVLHYILINIFFLI